MKTSSDGIDMICAFEGFVPTTYVDAAKVDTIGYGHAIRPDEAALYVGRRLTHEEGRELLARDVAIAEHSVNANVTYPLSQAQFDALVCLVFNVGTGAFAKSRLLQRLNAQDLDGVRVEWLGFSHIHGVTNDGLLTRRKRELARFFSTIAPGDAAEVMAAVAESLAASSAEEVASGSPTPQSTG